ncbi:restriction endonuclease subunit S [Terrisporobacter sp.]|uniref:restriction endonuclease subunit S n=1 Tax=Terrisporobacter sp. TaxID=1965305 RepID=UPI0026081649|nr:restriction endonuclease subunit S [Terrisporobacter sp.]
MKLEKLGKVNHGLTISRIAAKPDQQQEEIPLFTMQDLNIEMGNYDLKSEEKTVSVNKETFDKSLLSKENIVVIGLTVHKSYVIENHHAGKIIPSNFAYIYLDESKIDLNYFTWYFNEHPNIKKQLQVATQGSIIMALSIQMLRELEIDLPSIEIQRKLGEIYKLRRRKEKVLYEKNILEKDLYKQLMIKALNKNK